MEQEINKVSYIFKYKGKVTSEKSTKEKRLEQAIYLIKIDLII